MRVISKNQVRFVLACSALSYLPPHVSKASWLGFGKDDSAALDSRELSAEHRTMPYAINLKEQKVRKTTSSTEVELWYDRVVEVTDKHFVPCLLAESDGEIRIVMEIVRVIRVVEKLHQFIVLNRVVPTSGATNFCPRGQVLGLGQPIS